MMAKEQLLFQKTSQNLLTLMLSSLFGFKFYFILPSPPPPPPLSILLHSHFSPNFKYNKTEKFLTKYQLLIFYSFTLSGPLLLFEAIANLHVFLFLLTEISYLFYVYVLYLFTNLHTVVLVN